MIENVPSSGKIAAIIPIYKRNDGGNNTAIVQRDNRPTIIIPCPLKSVLDQLVRTRSIILCEQDNPLDQLGRQQLQPIPLSLDVTLVPIHYRSAPHNTHDGCTAYLNLAAIGKDLLVPDRPAPREKVSFTLPDGTVIHTVTNWETFENHRRDALLVHYTLALKNLTSVLLYLKHRLI